MSDPAEEPKLIVDEDWKTKVQREKDEHEQKKAVEAAKGESDDEDKPESSNATSATVAEETEAAAQQQQLPAASLEMLIASLGTQAMAAMGMVPGEDGSPLPVNHGFAKHFIDLIGVIEEKTKGNVTPEEGRYMQDTLYQLRMMFVEVKKSK